MYTIKKNISLKKAICDALNTAKPGNYQLMITDAIRPQLRKNNKEYELSAIKIRVVYEKNKWVVKEFNLSLNGINNMIKHNGDYELLDDFNVSIYSETY